MILWSICGGWYCNHSNTSYISYPHNWMTMGQCWKHELLGDDYLVLRVFCSVKKSLNIFEISEWRDRLTGCELT